MKTERPIIMKFGGTSVASRPQLLTILEIVRRNLSKRPVLVVSAVSGVTEALLKKRLGLVRKIHERLINNLFSGGVKSKVSHYVDVQIEKAERKAQRKNLTPKDLDELVSFGEIISSYIISQFLKIQGIAGEQVIATKLIMTDDNFQQAEFLPIETRRNVKEILGPMLENKIVPVVTGFIGKSKEGKTTTLGRGGSDYSASIIGSCLGVSEIQVWTDVDGVMTADPKIVKNAKNVATISFEEASELAVLGAKVLHPKTMLPAISENIPVRILNTHNPSHSGTKIMGEVKRANYVSAIAYKKGIKVIDIHSSEMFLMHGFLHKIFKIFDELKISVDFVSTSEVVVSLTIDGKYQTRELLNELKEFADVEVKEGRATVSVIGRPRGVSPVIRGEVYSLFENKKIDVEMISAGASKINETIVVKEEDVEEVIKILHKVFFNV